MTSASLGLIMLGLALPGAPSVPPRSGWSRVEAGGTGGGFVFFFGGGHLFLKKRTENYNGGGGDGLKRKATGKPALKEGAP